MAKKYVNFETPAEVKKKALLAVETAKTGGSLRKGTNECTKAIEKGEAAIVVIAEDVDPEEIVMHLPSLCSEKKIPYVYVAEKVALGKAAGLTVPSAAIAIGKGGPQQVDILIKEIVDKISDKLSFKAEVHAAAPAAPHAHKPAEGKVAAPAKKEKKVPAKNKDEKKPAETNPEALTPAPAAPAKA